LIVYVKTGAEIVVARLQYVLDFIERHPMGRQQIRCVLTKPETRHLVLYYGVDPDENGFFVPAQTLFFNENLKNIPSLFANGYDHDGDKIWSVENRIVEKKPFFRDGRFAFDVFETLFFHLSRYEEWFADTRGTGSCQMIPENHHLLVRSGIEQIPVVDRLVAALYGSFGAVGGPFPTRYVMTHDIDKIYKYNRFPDMLRAFAWPIVYKRNILWGIRNLSEYLRVIAGSRKDPYDSYDFLFKQTSFWHRKRVFFMAGGKTRYDLYDRYYRRDFPGILKKAQAAGYEPGLHPSFNTACRPELLQAEKDHLMQESGQIILHSRQHFLRFSPRETPRHLEKTSFSTDSSIGFTRRIGFRSGTGFEHKLYDFELEKPFPFTELPMIVMDSALIHQTHDNPDQFIEALTDFLTRNRAGTQITFNFHNSTFDSTIPRRKKLGHFYLQLEAFLANIRK
jgi:hypothetical protein